MPELPAAYLHLGGPWVKPEEARGEDASSVLRRRLNRQEPAATDDWLPGVRACNRIGREAELGACSRGALLEGTAVGMVRLKLNLKVLGFVKIVQLTKGEKRKKKERKKIAQSPGHRAENGLQVYQGSSMKVPSTQPSGVTCPLLKKLDLTPGS